MMSPCASRVGAGALLLWLCASVHGYAELDLHCDGSRGWTLRNGNGSIRVPAAVPGTVQTDLMRARVLEGDPLYRLNELEYRWVAYDNWTYSCSFPSPETQRHHGTPIYLVLEGVDTAAEIRVNGATVGHAANMHAQHMLDITSPLRDGSVRNTLEIALTSALAYGAAKEASYPYTVPRNVHVGSLPHRQFVRKTQSDFGWDWGPAFVPSGLTGRVALVIPGGGPWVRAVHTSQYWSASGEVVLVVKATVVTVGPRRLPAVVSACVDGGLCAEASAVLVPHRETVVELRIAIKEPRLWWPVGFGRPEMCTLEVKVASPRHPPHVVVRRIGLRQVELVQDPLPDGGKSFFFRVNGVPVYIKGANMIPVDVFADRSTPTRVRQLLSDAVAANMNMVRVWGGGLYQPDHFYDVCDELGLMVWQEFMFACSMYPRDEAFLGNVEHEVEWQVARLNHHPSIVLWGGNNENEEMLNWPETHGNRELYLVDYVKLYIDRIQPLVHRLDPTRAFVDSSPSNGIVSPDPYVKAWGIPQDPTRGDRHYYNTKDDCMNLSSVPAARFFSEFGFQGFPNYLSLRDITLPEDRELNSTWFVSRQRSAGGTDAVLYQMGLHFRLPALNLSTAMPGPQADYPHQQAERERAFEKLCHLSQVQQALCYDTWVRAWRRARSGSQRTMGALYWQLNDVWQAPTWSSIGADGEWKLLHYFARRFFEPIMASVVEEGSSLQIWVNNDQPRQVRGTLAYEVRTWEGAVVKFEETAGVPVPGLGSAIIATLDTGLLLDGLDRRSCMLRVRFCPERHHGRRNAGALHMESAADQPEQESHGHCSEYSHLFAYPKDIALGPAHIQVEVMASADDNHPEGPQSEATIRVSADTAALYVGLATTVRGVFSDNGFHLLPDDIKTVTFTGRERFDVAELRATLRVSQAQL